jgi:uncharacterized damage-inducible protein DinB
MMNFVRTYDYLRQSRGKLSDWIRPLRQDQYTQEFPFGLHSLRATMLEIAGVEWLYVRRLSDPQQALPPREDWPIAEQRQPTFKDLEPAWAEQAARTQDVIAKVRDWDAPIEYTATQSGKRIVVSTTKADIATQLCLHEVHHRAQAMAMLRQIGVPAENLDYSILMFRRREKTA